MWYVVWKNPLPCEGIVILPSGVNISLRKYPYFKGFGHGFCWGGLKEAQGFASEKEAMKCISEESSWPSQVNLVYIHPLNFEPRCLRDA